MQDFMIQAKKRIIAYETLVEKLQSAASANGLGDNTKLGTALGELRKSLVIARKTVEVKDKGEAPLWWMYMQTGEITNEHIEKLDADYMNVADIIREISEK